MLTARQLQEIKERAEKAFLGPWHTDSQNDILIENDGRLGKMIRKDDAQFVAHAREDIPALLNAVERYKQCYEICDKAMLKLHEMYEDANAKLAQVELAEAKARMENEQMRKNILELSEYIGQQPHSDLLEYIVDIMYDISQGEASEST